MRSVSDGDSVPGWHVPTATALRQAEVRQAPGEANAGSDGRVAYSRSTHAPAHTRWGSATGPPSNDSVRGCARVSNSGVAINLIRSHLFETLDYKALAELLHR
jgi:hypothetical protein